MTRGWITGGAMATAMLAAAAFAPSGGAGLERVIAPSRALTQTAALEDFDGTWRLASGQQNLSRALNGVADQLNLFIREIARSELHRRIRPEQRVHLNVEDETHISLGWDNWGPVRLTLGPRTQSVNGPEGNRIRASIGFRAGQLTHRNISDQGQRTSIYSLSPDTQRMTMAIRIRADQLPVDIVYRLNYRRQG